MFNNEKSKFANIGDDNTKFEEERSAFNVSTSGDVYIQSNHSFYYGSHASNYEHDDNGSVMNYSGCEDIVFSAYAENEGWEENYDY